MTILRGNIVIRSDKGIYRGFLLLWLPVMITSLLLLDGRKPLAGVSNDFTDTSERDISTRNYEQAEK